MRNALLLAVQFLTRIPVPMQIQVSPRQLGYSVLFYPLVGGLIGGGLYLLGSLLAAQPPQLGAALILAIWVFLSGGLHLDGLADCADAWVGGTGNREKTLAIMKDPAAGTVAVIVLVLVLLLKWVGLSVLITEQRLDSLFWIPVLGRSSLLLLMMTTPYIRKNGLGEQLVENLPVSAAKVILGLVLAIVWVVLGFIPVLAALSCLFLIRRVALHRLAGMTGDVYGASVELVELVALLSLALYV
ncbi:adenosylcobinamide-GDP ribazoletransferase [methane-oxidizing endosymbiont of Gigantopelta aegis]|uniref:adenosylcobinamide-GDP ribazoletransferase n=1 Tax=methane-oxidizing endosymbiont of Gigantopelta aegis TaxID=2794938 RepID=UPI0018DE3A01|nr:adenosylcobinamide-GDP ribazoletransferase [methane-oxidizing endosymbiont of Gigantopelta aegis]